MAVDKKKLAQASQQQTSSSDASGFYSAKTRKRDTHKTYAFWANKEQIDVWKCYQESNSELPKAVDLGLKAITEYMQNHPLKGDELAMYELKLISKLLEYSIYK